MADRRFVVRQHSLMEAANRVSKSLTVKPPRCTLDGGAP